MKPQIDRKQGTPQHSHPDPMTPTKFRACFEHCPRCGIVRDLRYGKYLSEADAQELEEIFCKGFIPAIPVGSYCGWCQDDLKERRIRRVSQGSSEEVAS